MKLELKPYTCPERIPAGTAYTFEIEMKPYPDHRTRTIRVWLPPEYDGERRFPVVYMHDGQNVLGHMPDNSTLNTDGALMSRGIAAIVVAIDTCDEVRITELTPPYPRTGLVNGERIPVFELPSTTETYAEFVIHTLKPLIDENFLTLPDAEHTCVGGISAGGSASYYMFMRNPEVFGKAIVCSPGFPVFPLSWLLNMVEEYDFSRLNDHRIAFYNGDQTLDVTSLDSVLAVYRKFKEKGMDGKHCMFLLDTRQEHYEGAWEKYMPELLDFLFAADNSQPTRPAHPQ